MAKEDNKPEKDLEARLDEIKKRIRETEVEVTGTTKDPESKKEIDPESEKKLKEMIDSEIEMKILERKVEEATKTPPPPHPAEEPVAPEDTRGIMQTIHDFKKDFHLCWKGTCRTITWITLPVYFAIATLLIACQISNRCGITSNTMTAIVFLAMFLLVAASLLLSTFSKYPRTALLFWIMLDIPLLILVLIFTIKFIGFIIFALIILLRLVQIARSEY